MLLNNTRIQSFKRMCDFMLAYQQPSVVFRKRDFFVERKKMVFQVSIRIFFFWYKINSFKRRQIGLVLRVKICLKNSLSKLNQESSQSIGAFTFGWHPSWGMKKYKKFFHFTLGQHLSRNIEKKKKQCKNIRHFLG